MRIFRWIVIVVFLVLTLIPFSWLIMASFKTSQQLFNDPFGFPKQISLFNYISSFSVHPLYLYFRNSMIVAIFSTFLGITSATLASYALLYRIHIQKFMYIFLIFGLFLPTSAFMVPVFFIIHAIGLYNTWWGLILVYAGFSFPLGFLIINTYMDTIPKEMLEAAHIDGASVHQAFRKIILPISYPGIVTAAIFLLITAWNELLYATLLTQDESARTIQAGIRFFLTTYAANYPQAFASTVMAILPTILVYIFLSDRVIEGMTAGALK